MEENIEYKSILDSDNFIKEFNSLENYLSRVMKRSQKSADGDFIEIPLTKHQLVDTNFSIAVSQNIFTQIAGGKHVRFNCVDKDLFFSEEEALTLLQNYELIQKQGGDLYFHETMYESGLHMKIRGSPSSDMNLHHLDMTHYIRFLFLKF